MIHCQINKTKNCEIFEVLIIFIPLLCRIGTGPFLFITGHIIKIYLFLFYGRSISISFFPLHSADDRVFGSNPVAPLESPEFATDVYRPMCCGGGVDLREADLC